MRLRRRGRVEGRQEDEEYVEVEGEEWRRSWNEEGEERMRMS